MHSDVELGDLGINYNPCEEFKDNIALFTPLKEANKLGAKLAPDIESIFADENAYPRSVAGWESLGGERGRTLAQRESFAAEYKCDYNAMGIEPPSYRLYTRDQCEAFGSVANLENLKSRKDAWIAKHVQGLVKGEGIRYYASAQDLFSQFRTSARRCPTIGLPKSTFAMCYCFT